MATGTVRAKQNIVCGSHTGAFSSGYYNTAFSTFGLTEAPKAAFLTLENYVGVMVFKPDASQIKLEAYYINASGTRTAITDNVQFSYMFVT